MTSNIQPFTYEDHTVRVVTIDGEPWFVLADLCKVLDLAKPSRVAMRIADDMKGAHLMSTPGGDQEMTIVSEAGMYEVIIRSDKPEAVAFRRWVTSEVLLINGPTHPSSSVTNESLDVCGQMESASVNDGYGYVSLSTEIAPKGDVFDPSLPGQLGHGLSFKGCLRADDGTKSGVKPLGRRKVVIWHVNNDTTNRLESSQMAMKHGLTELTA